MRSLFAVILILLLSATVSAQETGGREASGSPTGQSRSGRESGDSPATVDQRTTRFDLEAAVAARYYLTLSVLAVDFPEDHDYLTERVTALEAAGGTEEALALAVFNELKGIRQKYAEKLLFAPGEDLSRMLLSLAQFYDKVLAERGAKLCGDFAEDGSGVLYASGLSDEYAAELDRQSAAYFQAVASAFERPEYHGELGDRDWAVVLGTMVGLGSPESYLATIATGDRNDPDLCPALAAMFRASAVLKTPEGARTRADFAKNLTGY